MDASVTIGSKQNEIFEEEFTMSDQEYIDLIMEQKKSLGIECPKIESYEIVSETNPYAFEIIDGDFSLGDWVTVKLLNGKTYTRRVYDSRECGLYIVIKNYKYFLYDAI